ncbi:MAG: AEC family transporter [Bifidobacterium bifidum]
MGQFAIMVGQLVGFFIMLMVGYGCVRLRFYGQTALDGMCSLLLNVLIPLLVFSNAMAGADRAQVEANWGAMLLTAVMYALLILVFRLVAWALRLKGSRSHVFQAALIFGNAGFIGIMLALVLIMLGVRIPSIVLTPLRTIGGMATPMSLIYLGGLFALTKWWGVLKRYELYVGLVAKMIAFPLGLYALLTAAAGALPELPITHDMIMMITLVAGLPTMTTIAMFTARRNNMPDYAVGFVLVSTLFSLLSLTIVSAVVF